MGFFKRQDNKLLKDAIARELNFYQNIVISNDPDDIRILPFIPDFHGVQQISFTKGSTVTTKDFLILRDITEGFIFPNIIDIKIGFRTWGPEHSLEKQIKKNAKCAPTRNAYGFIVKGLRVSSLEFNITAEHSQVKTLSYDKRFGELLKPENVSVIAETFFDTKVSGYVPECAEIILKQIIAIYKAFLEQRKYNLYGSSLLVAYDMNAVREFQQGIIDLDQLEKFIEVKIIDFGNAFLSDGKRDDNFLIGLKNVIHLFQSYLGHSATKTIET